jgi:hypothetical protein
VDVGQEAMTQAEAQELPDVGAVLAGLLARVPRAEQPLLIAIAERMAADRYRGWAAEVPESERRAQLLACAAREEEIARHVESLFPDAGAIQSSLRAKHPDLVELNRSLFADRPLLQQFAIQARGERLGSATWRAFARESRGAAQQTFLTCAGLEVRNAEVLEAILAAGR